MTATEIRGITGTHRGRERARVVVLGGGYGGQLAAQTLARRTDATVTLVNDGERFVQRVRLHQLATGQPVDAPRYTDLLAGTGVRFVDDRATDLDLATRRVVLRDGGRARLRRAGATPWAATPRSPSTPTTCRPQRARPASPNDCTRRGPIGWPSSGPG